MFLKCRSSCSCFQPHLHSFFGYTWSRSFPNIFDRCNINLVVFWAFLFAGLKVGFLQLPPAFQHRRILFFSSLYHLYLLLLESNCFLNMLMLIINGLLDYIFLTNAESTISTQNSYLYILVIS